MRLVRKSVVVLATLVVMSGAANAVGPNLIGKTDRPLRYTPDAGGFVIENGREFFNRPLYGTNGGSSGAFRIDAGDKPEFSFYLPGRGGNVRMGIRTASGAKWLNDMATVKTRYDLGVMSYDITDPLLGGATLKLTVAALANTEGAIVRAEAPAGAQGWELVVAYGGLTGARHNRNGDIGTDKTPMSEYFQLKPEYCKDSRIDLNAAGFRLSIKTFTMAGVFPAGAKGAICDAGKWGDAAALLASGGTPTETPLATTVLPLTAGGSATFVVQMAGEKQELATPEKLDALYKAALERGASVWKTIVVDTPDPFINSAAGALGMAADGVWDDQQGAFMHGAVAWRMKLLGWRGSYSGDELGLHDRTRRHLLNYFPKQNTKPIVPGPTTQDATANYARNEPALHTNGDLSNSHYDMNVVAIDALFRHLLWTGDVEFAKEQWPVIERHLAWEKRLFRRPFGADSLPLYEAYVCIWASDDLQYNGGGVTHSSAYNLYHNRMAARVAKMIGVDPTPYEKEADLIGQAMRRELWLKETGCFAEWKDLLGLQLTHPNAALWTVYHTIDSEVPTPQEAWSMTRYIDTSIPRIPVAGPGVPAGNYTLPTTTWMPYTWSTNNVVMAEVMHTSLAYWQSDRDENAVKIFKGALLDSMYLGLCPGNVGMCTYFDFARGESQRDFSDGVGMTSRALVEGLFGIRPDALAGELTIRPGFPADWDRASIDHADLSSTYQRSGETDRYTITQRFAKPMRVRLDLVARAQTVKSVAVNGKAAQWKCIEDAVGDPRIEVQAPAGATADIAIVWNGEAPAGASAPVIAAIGKSFTADFSPAKVEKVVDPQGALSNIVVTGSTITATVTGTPGARTIFARVRQGGLTWDAPVGFEVRPAVELLAAQNQLPDGLSFRVRNNTGETLQFAADWITVNGAKTQSSAMSVSPMSESKLIKVTSNIVVGTNRLRLAMPSGALEADVTNWLLQDTPAQTGEAVVLGALLNASVSQIFTQQYDSPRSPYVSLAIPRQGIGSWAHPDAKYEVNDAGLREVAKSGTYAAGKICNFATAGPGDGRNIAFVSQWDNHPREISVPLSGKAQHIYLLMAGSTNSMQSRFVNGEVVVTYADDTIQVLKLENPTTWWPIDQDYRADDYAFRRPEAIPPRVNLASGDLRIMQPADIRSTGGKINGGAATILDLPLDRTKELKSLTVRARANEVIIGLMGATLIR